MKDKTKYTIGDFSGEWTIKNSWVSDLGFIMIAFWNEEKKVIMNVNTQTTLEQALKLPWVKEPEDSDETSEPNLDIIY
jgi:hypothetical protein